MPIVVAIAGCLLVAGCGSGGDSGASPSKRDAAAIRAYQQAHLSPGMKAAAERPDTARPSAAARLVCGDEIRTDVSRIFALATPVSATSTWQGGVFTCTYRMPSGPLTISVKDTLAGASGQAYFNALRAFDGAPPLLKGLEAFGLPSYETTDGRVVFLKDGKTLAVDAGSLPMVAGPSGESRTDVAYAVAADVIGCWSE